MDKTGGAEGRYRGGGGDYLGTYVHVCTAPGHRQECGEGWGGAGAGWRGSVREEGDICHPFNHRDTIFKSLWN